jgi:hypothetical protein
MIYQQCMDVRRHWKPKAIRGDIDEDPPESLQAWNEVACRRLSLRETNVHGVYYPPHQMWAVA